MDSWRRTLAQLRDLLNGLAPTQRLTLIVVPLLSMALFGMILSQGNESNMVPLESRTLTAAETKQIQSALRRAELTGSRVEGGRILIPQADAARYRTAVAAARNADGAAGDGLSDRPGTRSFLSMFPDTAQRQELIDVARSEAVARVIKKMWGIADAHILYWQRTRNRYFSDGKATAVLSVTLREGVDLSDDLCRSLQRIVGGALGVADEDVTVVDTRQGNSRPRLDGAESGAAILSDIDRQPAAEVPLVGTGPGHEPAVTSGVTRRRLPERKANGGLPGPWIVPAGVTAFTTIVVGVYVRLARRRGRKGNRASPPAETMPPPAIRGPTDEASADTTTPSVIIPVAEEGPEPGGAVITAPEPEPPDVATGVDVLPFPAARTPASTPFGFLNEESAEHVASFLTEEHPQTTALILSHLPPSLAARVLEGLPPATQVEVVRRVATSKPASPTVVREVAESLKGRIAANDGLETMTEGLSVAARLLSDADRRSNGALLERLAREDAPLVDRLRRMLFDFDDLLTLADDDIRSLYARTERLNWSLALKGASAKLKSKILRSLPPLASEALQEELHRSGPVRVGDIALAQQQIADQAGLSHAPDESSDPASVAA